MEVFSFGNGDFLFEIFGAVTGLMGNSSYMTLVRLTILIGFLILGYQLFFSLRVDVVAKGFLKQYILIIVIFYTFFVPKTDVIIRDEIKNTQVTVNDVPYGIGMMAHLFTTAEKGITTLVETYFSTPSDMRFSKSGYAFSAMMLDTLKYGTATNVYFKRTFNDYVVNCFFTDVLYGDKDLNTVINTSNNLLAIMNPVSSAAMFTLSYSAANPQGTQVSCSTAYSTITTDIGTEVTAGIAQLNNILGVDITAKLPVVATTILGVSQSATDTISQAIAANTIKSALTQTAMYSGMSGDAVMYATSLAEQQQRSSWAVGGELAKKYIPVIRQILEAIIYGLFPMLFLGMMTPMGFQFVRVYMTFLIWLLMWSPLFAILNLIINTRLNGALSATYGYFSLGKMPFIYETTNDLVAMAGYMAWLVPTIAFAVAKGSDYAMVNMASGITQSTSMTQSTAARSVTGAGGAMQSTAMAGHMQAAAAYGSDTVAAGGAASSFFNASYGASWAAQGNVKTGMVASTDVQTRTGNAEGRKEVADAENTSVSNISKTDTVGKTAQGVGAGEAVKGQGISNSIDDFKTQTNRNLSDQQAYQQAAANLGMSDSQLAFRSASMDHGAKAGQTITMESFVAKAEAAGVSRTDSFRALAEVTNGNSMALTKSLGYSPSQVQQFMSDNASLSVGQLKGIVQGANENGIKVGDFGQMKSYMDTLRSVGAIEGMREGVYSASDVKEMGKVGMMKEAGDVDAKSLLQGLTGMDARQQTAYLNSGEGAQKMAQLQTKTEIAGMLGKGDDLKGLYSVAKQEAGGNISLTLDKDSAAALNTHMHSKGNANFNAKEGDRASFAVNTEKGTISMAHTERGGQSSSFDLSSSTSGRRVETGTRESHGSQNISYDVSENKFGRGPQMSPDSVRNAALANDQSLANRISSAQTVPARDREEMAQATNLAQSLGGVISSQGKIMSYSEVNGQGTLKVGTPFEGLAGSGASAQAGVGMGRRNTEEQNFNLLYSTVRDIQSNARQGATNNNGEFNQAKFNELYTSGLNNLVRGTDALSQGKTEFSFGASAIVGEPIESVKSMLNDVKIK